MSKKLKLWLSLLIDIIGVLAFPLLAILVTQGEVPKDVRFFYSYVCLISTAAFVCGFYFSSVVNLLVRDCVSLSKCYLELEKVDHAKEECK